MRRVAPGDVDEPRRAIGRTPDRVDEREVLLEEIVADDRTDAGAMLSGQRAGGEFEIGGAHVVRRRVDEVARQRHALGDGGQFAAVDAVG